MIRISVLLFSSFILSGCGGGGSGLNGLSTSAPVTSAESNISNQGIWFTKDNNPNQGAKYLLLSDGKRLVWFDADLLVNEDVKLQQGTGIVANDGEAAIVKGHDTNEKMVLAIGDALATLPVGNVTYIGDAVMRVKLTDADENKSVYVEKFGSANMEVNFYEKNGKLFVLSTDSKASLSSNIVDTTNGWLVGSNGIFISENETYEDTWSNFTLGCSIFGGCTGTETKQYDVVVEGSQFGGTLVGKNGTSAIGIAIGDNHEIAVVVGVDGAVKTNGNRIQTYVSTEEINTTGGGTSGSRVGNTIFSSDGTTYTQVGNTTFGSDGSTYTQVGNTTFASDGTTYTKVGNSTFASNGTTYNQVGNFVFGSDGTSCNIIGQFVFCN